ncbi:MAG: hypothetical protein NXH97_17065 [Rhodobacteraceae bacterium]|nr:hypothetical protein [Paracoccaceae bacterium]
MLVCLALVLGSIGTGHARGHAPTAGLVTLCINGETVAAAVDANGRPVTATPLCPDCIGMGLAAALLSDSPAPKPRPTLELPAVRSVDPAPHPAPPPPARAPPRRT